MERTDIRRAAWRKSSYSSPNGSDCVEVKFRPDGGAAVRDSKDPAGAQLTFTHSEWRAFIAGARDGEFDV